MLGPYVLVHASLVGFWRLYYMVYFVVVFGIHVLGYKVTTIPFLEHVFLCYVQRNCKGLNRVYN
jgi:hypothetical protein